MKPILVVSLWLVLAICLGAADLMTPWQTHITERLISRECVKVSEYERPDTSRYVFSIDPQTLLTSYYDYMIGSYNNIPLWNQPDPDYGGYFLTFHGQRTATGTRRVFFAYIDDEGIVEPYSQIPEPIVREGYPSLAIDAIAGKPLYAWHAYVDADPEYEIQMAWDAFLFGSAGLISNPINIIDNPVTLPPPYNTADNEFIWPSVQTGPSPLTGMRRVYVLTRNITTHTTGPSENVRIAYADFNAVMLESETPLTWNYTSIPTLDAWNHDTTAYRRMAGSFVVGNDDRIYYIGYHITRDAAEYNIIEEPDLDVFVCNNYGQGIWQRVTGDSRFSAWNPHNQFTPNVGFFKLSDGVTPVPDGMLKWKVLNSDHFNAVFDSAYNTIHLPLLWSQYFIEPIDGDLYQIEFPEFHAVKDLVYDIDAQTFGIREVYPRSGNPVDNLMWLPWDEDGDGLTDDYYINPDDPSDPEQGNPLMHTTWPFPHWDRSLHDYTMMFHYNNLKITQPNQYGHMAMVWQEANRARLYNTDPSSYPELAPYAQAPEIWISTSSNFGIYWSEPVALNKVETTQLAGMKPMWVYPADQVKSINSWEFNGKLALLFMDDFTWGADCIGAPITRTGGNIKFMELLFPSTPNVDPTANNYVSRLQQNYPNPFNPETNIRFTLPEKGTANLSIYNTKGQLVKTLMNGLTKSGETSLVWNGTDNSNQHVATGLYFYKLTANGKVETRKMMLMK
jgi:hypothetical protein